MDFKNTVLGIELGSTKIKGVLLDENNNTIASGGYDWENRFENGIWTYSLEDIHNGIQGCFKDLANDVEAKFGEPLTTTGAIGISGMMHGYFPLNEKGELMVPFRTWRNRITGPASEELTEKLNFFMPQRWGTVHVYQAVLNGESNVNDIKHLSTLAGYITYRLTGEHALGMNEASGMFPIDSDTLDYDGARADILDEMLAEKGVTWKIRDVLPKALPAGACAGYLTEEGARFLDPSGKLQPGIPVAPPEGDAGTGMVATNAVRVGTGNVSAGTSSFIMIVTDKKLALHKELNMITTPDGTPVAMVHSANCTSDINAWVDLFAQVDKAVGGDGNREKFYPVLFAKALEGKPNGGGLMSYNYFAGEAVTDTNEGRPMLIRTPDAEFTIENLMRTHLMSAVAVLGLGIEILNEEGVEITSLTGHGGYFKQKSAGQKVMSAAVKAPVSVMKNAAVGGAYGMALLAAYMLRKGEGQSLADWLDQCVFKDAEVSTETASPEEIEGFAEFLTKYKAALEAEKAAIKYFS